MNLAWASAYVQGVGAGLSCKGLQVQGSPSASPGSGDHVTCAASTACLLSALPCLCAAANSNLRLPYTRDNWKL